MKTGLIYTLALCVLGLGRNVASAADIYVDSNVTSGTNDGTTWSTAYSNLVDAVADANSNGANDNIRIRRGNYCSHSPLSITEPCVLIGEAGTTIGAPFRAPVLFDVESTQVHFRDIVFESGNCFVNGNESELRFHDCRFRNSSMHAVYARDCPVVEVHDCLFKGNRGGLFTIFSGRVEVLDSQFLGNQCGAQGGAVFVDDCETLMIARSLFHSNTAVEQGGAIFINRVYPGHKRSANLVNCVIRNNRALCGGGIYCLNCQLRVSSCTIINNHASWDTGGIAALRYGEVAVENTILWGNRDDTSNSLMFQQFSTLPSRLVHCCIEDPSGFTSAWGRGVINRNPRLRLDSQLEVGSPCIDAGDLLYYPDALLGEDLFSRHNPGQDIAGNDRLVGPEIDMGAFEQSLFDFGPLDSPW
ncbi:MAG: right-handed parallel beta-helix repeat-containing protein [Planctomycetota bacterium]|nr:right-handed parallel beta-helix repeat-containing protein [Planctomycetota bacterium]